MMVQNSGSAPNEMGLDLSNLIVVKASLGNEIRKVTIQNFEITRDELLLMMQRIFKGRLSPSDNITLKYRDEGRTKLLK